MNTSKDLFSILSEMEIIWHSTFGCDGNHYIGNLLGNLMLSTITYKRICDICEEQYQVVSDVYPDYESAYKEGACELDYKINWSWNYVTKSSDSITSLQNAIKGLNEANFINLPYGDTLIPSFFCNASEGKEINKILSKWYTVLKKVDLSCSNLSEEDWKTVSKFIRNKM